MTVSDQDKGVTLVTPSYHGDFPLFTRLADSVDRFTAPDFRHLVVVPPGDIPLFQGVAGPKTILMSTDAILPVRLHLLPKWMNPLRSGREVFVRPGLWMPVRGWVMQQLLKFAAALAAPTETVVFVDSDVMLLRPLTQDTFRTPDGRFRLFYEKNVCGHFPAHQQWYRHAAKVLGLPSTDPFWGDNYINDLIVWRKTHARECLDRIETVTGKPWWKALGESKTMAEYMLYGIHATNHLGGVPDQCPTDSRIHLTSWSGDLSSEAGRDAFVDMLLPTDLAVAVQSQARLPLDIRNALLDKLQTRASEQDAA
jgi:hypothetical protein